MSRVLVDGFPFVPYHPERFDIEESRRRGHKVLQRFDARRSVRQFTREQVPRDLIETAIRAASTAPSGAHKQPWTFVAISSPSMKQRIREAAEEEERKSYEGRMSEEWLEALAPLGTDWQKPYLEVVPWVVVLFAQRYGVQPDGTHVKHYYVQESCGIAAGLFVAALHEMGLSTLTHTPSPMRFLSELLGRPENEKPLMLFPIGYATPDALVPDIQRKSLDDVSVWFEGD